jgi:hypothetical protein
MSFEGPNITINKTAKHKIWRMIYCYTKILIILSTRWIIVSKEYSFDFSTFIILPFFFFWMLSLDLIGFVSNFLSFRDFSWIETLWIVLPSKVMHLLGFISVISFIGIIGIIAFIVSIHPYRMKNLHFCWLISLALPSQETSICCQFFYFPQSGL